MLYKRSLVFITLICFIVATHGCYTSKSVTLQQLEEKPRYVIQKVVTTNNEVHEFSGGGGQFIENMIVGYTSEGESIKLPIEQISTIYVREFGLTTGGKVVVGVVLVAALVGLVVGVIAFFRALESIGSSSCPFIYAFDGKKYVLDGEPYGGAVCQGLQRTDYCRMDSLSPVGGEYRILLANELNEIQYIDEFELLIVDHPKDATVYQDADGHFYTIGVMQKPLHITDAAGDDHYQLLSAEDCLLWASGIDYGGTNVSNRLRDTLFISFPRPRNVEKAKLIVSGGNTIWGSHMLRQMVGLFGDQVAAWYEEMLTPQWQQMIEEWNDCVELYHLQVHIWGDGGWMQRGEIMVGGPLVCETRVIPLDLTGVAGDSVTIRLTPPSGFWQFNMFAVDYSENLPVRVREVSATKCTTHDGRDVRDKLESTDAEYYVMPEIGQQAYLVFPAPELLPDLDRTVYAKVSGYYDLKIETEDPPQSAEIYRILSDSDYAVTFSKREYERILNDYVSSQE